MISLDIDKYEKSVINSLNKENVKKIIKLLVTNNCDYIEELLEDYLDIFVFDYNDFKNKFDKLNKIYNNNLINEIRDDMNILEEFYTID